MTSRLQLIGLFLGAVPWIVTGHVVVGCNQPATQIHATVIYDDGVGLTSLLINANGETRATDALHDLTISVPDSWADQSIGFEIAGLVATDKRVYGKLDVTPKIDSTIDVELTLQPLQCSQPCIAGAKRCEGNGIATCLVVDTCSVWSQAVACEAPTPFCSSGACAATCSDECATGATVCDGTAAVKTCGQSDSDSCLDWKSTACPANETCSAGACSSPMMCANPVPNWKELSPAVLPPARREHAMAYDAARGKIVMFGGVLETSSATAALDDTWTWDGRDWKLESPTVIPDQLRGHAMAYDAVNQKVVMFGGGSTWTWNGNDWKKEAPATSPSSRQGQSMAYDSVRNKVVLFGGDGLSDTWLWSGQSWSKQTTASSPVVRNGRVMTYDAARNQLVAFGGIFDDGSAFRAYADTWIGDSSTWTQASPATFAAERGEQAMTYDVVTKKVIMFGGRYALDLGGLRSDTWSWNGVTWTQEITASKPRRRRQFAMAYDVARSQVVLFGGNPGATFDSGSLDDTWVLEWTCP
jgi:hypothetical protein